MSVPKKDGSGRNSNLVINIGDVHHKMDIIAKVIRQNPSQNVLRDIVSGLGLMGSPVLSGPKTKKAYLAWPI